MMKGVVTSLLLFLFICSFTEESSGQQLVLPIDEILRKYFKISEAEFFPKCEAKDTCLASKLQGLEKLLQMGGERLINLLVNEAKKLPSVAENDWNRLIQNRCSTNVFFTMLVQVIGEGAKNCCSSAEVPSDDTLKKATDEFIQIYCSRVKNLAKRKFQSG